MEKENEIHNSNNYDVIDNNKDITFKNKKIKYLKILIVQIYFHNEKYNYKKIMTY